MKWIIHPVFIAACPSSFPRKVSLEFSTAFYILIELTILEI